MSELKPTPEFEEKIRRATAVPDASPTFVKNLGSQLMSHPAKPGRAIAFRPAWAIVIVLLLALMVLAFPGLAAAIGRLFGYVPGMGLVENTGNLRMLAEPVSVQREGVTLSVTNLLVYPDRIELVYQVDGISPQNDGYQATDAARNPTAFCGGVNIGETTIKDGDARLRLPDGTLLERDYTGLYQKNVYAMTPVYQTSIPTEVTELTMVLKCIPQARLGAVPENWEIPLALVTVPAGTVMGVPVQEVQPSTSQPSPATEPATVSASQAAVPSTPAVKLVLERAALLDNGSVFYFHLDVSDPDPSLQSVVPGEVYVIDSQGEKIQLTSGPIYPVQHPTGSPFEYFSKVRPASGPLTFVIQDAVAYYAPLYVEPRQATPEQMSFTFDAGADPQPGQSWPIDQEIEIAGYPLKITSARAITFEDIRTPSFIDGSQGYDYGYQFAIQFDPAIKASAEMDIVAGNCWLTNDRPIRPGDSSILYTQLCREGYPKGLVKVTIREFSVLVAGTWEAVWTPQ